MREPEINVFMCQVSESTPYRGIYGKIKNTLKALQGYVGGTIQVVSLTKGLFVICNDDGKILKLPVNRAITDNGYVYDVVVGNALVVRVDGEEFASISEEDIPLIEKHFPPVRLISANVVKLLSDESLPEGGS